ncbi:hypothetical protein F5Y18DRAFT_369138 [Xylariaceae sp. FL1019]|nr:hypothetical protein F5Y18DRAFT_369138 [Xylariaceae sp. FL1019]
MTDYNPLTATQTTTEVSKTTLTITGLQVDIYGLAELPPASNSISCLWLHHGRLRKREDMAYVAHHMLSSYNSSLANANISASTRGLIAISIDVRNHGSRIVNDLNNESWNKGNKTHAQDMFTTVNGTVVDTMHLMDALPSYLFGDGHGPGAPTEGKRRIDQNIVLGVSLGGHVTWQLLFAEPRVTAGVVVIGCPDYMNLMKDRARRSKLQTYTEDEGASFIGSKDFPESLVAMCKKFDAKGTLFGTGEVPKTPSAAEKDRIRPMLDSRIKGKRIQILSGGADKLVPYKDGKDFLDFFKDATSGWWKEGNVYVEDNLYPKVGHKFEDEMLKDATRFVLDTVKSSDAIDKAVSPKI